MPGLCESTRSPDIDLVAGAETAGSNRRVAYWSRIPRPGHAWQECKLDTPCPETRVVFSQPGLYIDPIDQSAYHSVRVAPGPILTDVRFVLTFDSPDETCRAKQIMLIRSYDQGTRQLMIPKDEKYQNIATKGRDHYPIAPWNLCDRWGPAIPASAQITNQCALAWRIYMSIQSGDQVDPIDGAYGFRYTCNRQAQNATLSFLVACVAPNFCN
jgi:hypothetical protein